MLNASPRYDGGSWGKVHHVFSDLQVVVETNHISLIVSEHTRSVF